MLERLAALLAGLVLAAQPVTGTTAPVQAQGTSDYLDSVLVTDSQTGWQRGDTFYTQPAGGGSVTSVATTSYFYDTDGTAFVHAIDGPLGVAGVYRTPSAGAAETAVYIPPAAPADRGFVFLNLHLLDLHDKQLASSFAPLSGSIGTQVVISGSGLTGAASVTFNGTPATFTVDSDTQITATVPSSATSGQYAAASRANIVRRASAMTAPPACVRSNR